MATEVLTPQQREQKKREQLREDIKLAIGGILTENSENLTDEIRQVLIRFKADLSDFDVKCTQEYQLKDLSEIRQLVRKIEGIQIPKEVRVHKENKKIIEFQGVDKVFFKIFLAVLIIFTLGIFIGITHVAWKEYDLGKRELALVNRENDSYILGVMVGMDKAAETLSSRYEKQMKNSKSFRKEYEKHAKALFGAKQQNSISAKQQNSKRAK